VIVELIGASGAGKSTLLRALADELGSSGPVVPWTALVTDRPGLRWARDHPHIANLVADVRALPACLLSLESHRGFFRLAWARLARHAPSPFAKANYARNVLRKVGVYELARSVDRDGVHLFDEGPILSAYQLFGYARGPISSSELARFAELVPLPDLVVHVRAPIDVLVRRAAARSDRRRELAHADPRRLRALLQRATRLFDDLAEVEPLASRTVTVDLPDERPETLAAAVAAVRRAMPALPPSGARSSERIGRSRRATLIAFVGSEASGKSTVLAELGRRLRRRHAVVRVHAGKPPSTVSTYVPHVLLPALRRLFPEQRTSRVVEERDRDAGAPRGTGFPLLFGVRSVMLAYERRALLRRAAASGAGTIVLSDRYPSSASGAADGPQLAHLVPLGGGPSLRRTLAWVEDRLYRAVPAPDVVFHLTAPLDVVLTRNAARSKREPEEYVRFRHALSSKLRFDGVPVHVVDTDRALEVVVKEIEEVILDLDRIGG
jgi:thymidylate kinase